MELQYTFLSISTAIIKLFMLMLIGYVMSHRKIVGDKFVDTLSQVLVRVIFPALIITKTIKHFSFAEYGDWWVLPLSAVLFSATGMAIAAGVLRLFKGFSSGKEFMTGCAFQNCGYLPMNLILFSFAGAVADKLLIYLFLFVMGFNLLMWSLVPLFLTGTLKSKFRIGVLFTPPVVATLFSLLWVAVMGKGSLPKLVADPLNQLGQAAFPIAMITLGAYLHRYRAYIPQDKMPLAAGIVIKLLLFPALVLLALWRIPMDFDLKFFLFLQSVMPTAVSLVVIGGYCDADNRFYSSVIFYTHLIAIFSTPVWLSVFHFLTG